jgi:hypothetical protein
MGQGGFLLIFTADWLTPDVLGRFGLLLCSLTVSYRGDPDVGGRSRSFVWKYCGRLHIGNGRSNPRTDESTRVLKRLGTISVNDNPFVWQQSNDRYVGC